MNKAKNTVIFRKAYSTYYPLVLNILYKKVSNREDAEDICQEVFIRFLDNFEAIENKKNWLMTALRYEISNFYRKKSNQVQDEIDIENVRNDISVFPEDDKNEARMIIKEAIENEENYKDEQERVIFELMAINNYTYKETARYMGMSKGKVEYKYNQVEKRILNCLKQKGITTLKDLL